MDCCIIQFIVFCCSRHLFYIIGKSSRFLSTENMNCALLLNMLLNKHTCCYIYIYISTARVENNITLRSTLLCYIWLNLNKHQLYFVFNHPIIVRMQDNKWRDYVLSLVSGICSLFLKEDKSASCNKLFFSLPFISLIRFYLLSENMPPSVHACSIQEI